MSGIDKPERRLIAHAAHKRIGISISHSGGFDPKPLGGRNAACHSDRVCKVCFVAGALESNPANLPDLLEQFLPAGFEFDCLRAVPQRQLAELEGCDCLLLVGQVDWVLREGLDRIRAYCRRGRPIVAARTAGRALPIWPDFDRDVLGIDYPTQSHSSIQTPTNVQADVRIISRQRNHPVLKDVERLLRFDGPNVNGRLAPDADVLLTATTPVGNEPVAWARLHRGGRIFCTLLGSPSDFNQRHFLRLLANATLWASEREG